MHHSMTTVSKTWTFSQNVLCKHRMEQQQQHRVSEVLLWSRIFSHNHLNILKARMTSRFAGSNQQIRHCTWPVSNLSSIYMQCFLLPLCLFFYPNSINHTKCSAEKTHLKYSIITSYSAEKKTFRSSLHLSVLYFSWPNIKQMWE